MIASANTEKYKIVEVTLITYSGKHVKTAIETDYISLPIRQAKEMVLDQFKQFCKDSDDPFVKVAHMKVKHLFNNQYDRSENNSARSLRMCISPKENVAKHRP